MSLPRELLQSLQDAKGFNENAFIAVHVSGEQVTAIRKHPVKQSLSPQQWKGESIPWCLHGIYLPERPSFTLDPSFHAGAYYVQDASSMFLWHVLEQLIPYQKGKKVLDLCAAPGGKSTLLASYFTDGLLVSNEVIKSRASVLVENLTKWGYSHSIVTNNDPSHFQSLGSFFDVIVVDAPCSGSGLFRKDPEAIEEWSLDHVQLCSQRQQRILADILPSLKQDGILIYATCSYSIEEDEMIADWLVEEMKMESLSVDVPEDWKVIATTSAQHQASGYRFYPDRVKGEGFFIAAFRKSAADENGRRDKKTAIVQATRKEVEQLTSFMPVTDQYKIFKQGEQFRLIDERWFESLEILVAHTYIRKAGVGLGDIKGKDMVPAHELAVSILPLDHFSSISVNLEQAIQYLRRQDISLQTNKGWNLVKYGDLPLGWIKALSNRINNYYPQEWRILK